MKQSDNRGTQDPAGFVRHFVLSTDSLHSIIGFAVMGILSLIFLLLTLFHGLDLFKAIAKVGPEIYLAATLQSMAMPDLIANISQRFANLRGTLATDPLAWLITLLIALVLMVGHYRRFQTPQGQSLKDVPQSAPVAKQLLSIFGYFKDIAIPIAAAGKASNDFFAMRQVFYAPKGQVSRILKGKPSANQQRVLGFFMVHEYAHAVAKDNLANSVFQVVVSGYVVLVLLLAFPAIALMSTIVSMVPGLGYWHLMPSVPIACLFTLSVIGCFYGMLISYLKAREFFADRAAFALYPDLLPYGSGYEERPDTFSAFSADISPYERELHKQGYSLHARNMLVFFWGFWLCIRTLYLLTVPNAFLLTILLFDLAGLVAFGLLYRSLPKRPKQAGMRPLLPWLVTTIAIMTIAFAGPGIIGLLKMLHMQLFSDSFGRMVGLPPLVLLLGFLGTSLVLWFRRLVAFRSRVPTRKGRFGRRFFMRLLMMPGLLLEGAVMVFGCSIVFSFLEHFLSQAFLSHQLLVNAGLAAIGGLFVLMIYWQYQALFSRFEWRSAVGAFLGAVLFAILLVSAFSMMPTMGQFGGPANYDWAGWQQSWSGRFRGQSWTFILSVGVFSAIFYLVLRSLAFWAQDRLIKIEQQLGRARYL